MLNEQKCYLIDRVLHWCSSVLIIMMLLLMGSQIHNIDYTVKGAIEHKQDAIEVHFIMGALVLLLLIARIVWSYVFRQKIKRQPFKNRSHQLIVKLIHFILYGILLTLIVSGFIMVTHYEHPLTILNLISFSQGEVEKSLFGQANRLHLYLQNVLYTLIFIHLVGAMYSRK